MLGLAYRSELQCFLIVLALLLLHEQLAVVSELEPDERELSDSEWLAVD
jgi:hypothetical protein